VAARETATGRTFQFKVNDAALLKSLKVGQKIYANFATKKVSVDGLVPCCSMK
jgi:Cu/Ag efflux protein CusF